MAGSKAVQPRLRLRTADVDLRARPESVFAAFADEPYAAFLDSRAARGSEPRRSFIACRPVLVLRAHGRTVETIRKGRGSISTEDPLEALRRVVREMGVLDAGKSPGEQGLIGGLIGYLGYELGGQIESLALKQRESGGVPDLYFCLYDTVLVYDHAHSSWSMSSFSPRPLSALRRELMEALERAAGSRHTEAREGPPAQPLLSNFTRVQYCAAVRRVKRLIRDGEVYQVNLSQRFSADISCPAWDLYRAQRRLNPAPWSCYLKTRPLPPSVRVARHLSGLK